MPSIYVPAARLMTARYSGTCGACSGSIAKGQKIYYSGKGGTSHESCGPVAPGTASSAPRNYKSTYGTCEDAPCCGCCGTSVYGSSSEYNYDY